LVTSSVSRGSEPIVIVGGGIAGLSAAIRLQAAGNQVILLEKNSRFGGKMGELVSGAYRWDTGPSVLTMRGGFQPALSLCRQRPERLYHTGAC
jgi:phytoene dehydrogenase-like protein